MDFLTLSLITMLLFAASYAGFLFWRWVFSLWNRGAITKESAARVLSAFVIALAVVSVAFPFAGVSVYAQSTIDFDLTPFFESLNVYLPIFIGIFAIVGGIAGAIALARYVMSVVVRAFSGSMKL